MVFEKRKRRKEKLNHEDTKDTKKTGLNRKTQETPSSSKACPENKLREKMWVNLSKSNTNNRVCRLRADQRVKDETP
jgi:hypothetical protein